MGRGIWKKKKTFLLHGTKTSNVLNDVLTEIYHLKKDNSVKYSRRNDNIRPFESGGEQSKGTVKLHRVFLSRCSVIMVVTNDLGL
ncbi:Brix domain-containing protein [Artemisia annua]|uniref:Brix domain-containing protein n=1 Tax=Artemisia annua TaxID=35608 RepID=A0A2U1M301_ARTAN|nr:Brix domain-containing protein [Artemisia annua]